MLYSSRAIETDVESSKNNFQVSTVLHYVGLIMQFYCWCMLYIYRAYIEVELSIL